MQWFDVYCTRMRPCLVLCLEDHRVVQVCCSLFMRAVVCCVLLDIACC